MCLIKVAHRRDSGEFVRFTAEDGGDEEEEDTFGHDHGGGSGPPQLNQPMQQGYNRPRFGELMSMVSDLTRVVSPASAHSSSSSTTTEWVHGSGFPMMSGSSPSPSSSSASDPILGSGSWVGHKRGREQETGVGVGASAGGSSQLIQDVTRHYRTIGSQGESSSGAIPLQI